MNKSHPGLTLGFFIIMLTGTAYTNTECQLVEYPDHYEAVCVGDAKYVPQDTGNTKPVTVVVVNGERRPPPAVMEDAIAARKKLILDLRQKDLEMNTPASGMSK